MTLDNYLKISNKILQTNVKPYDTDKEYDEYQSKYANTDPDEYSRLYVLLPKSKYQEMF